MHPPFPFSAVVGQEPLKRALLLGVIHPGLGGVLVRGTKGVAKSTAVRALAALLPPIETVAGCPFQRRPGEAIPDWPLPGGAAALLRPAPLVELPLGATEDRLLGSLHLERALRGERAFEPGLLASANRGILYIDEVNLLPDHLVDVLLDAAAGGVHRLEREGLSVRHPARFLLVGTMNPEEGDLRPQLLDRFGLVVDVADLTDPGERAEAVRRRLAYEADPEGFVAAWQEADRAEGGRLGRARDLLPEVRVPDAVLQALSERCLAAGVEGLRADLTLCQAARAWAAYQGRREVEPADVDLVAELALAHRRTRPPDPPPGGGRRKNEPGKDPGRDPAPGNHRTGTDHASGPAPAPPVTASSGQDRVFPAEGAFAARVAPPAEMLARSRTPARRGKGRGDRAGWGPARAAGAKGGRISWAATLRAAAPAQERRGWRGPEAPLVLTREDLRVWPRHGPAGCLLLFLLDASGSMAAWKRMRQTKAAVLALLNQAYQRGDRVALLAFRGEGTRLVLPPSRGLASARHALEELAVGGSTPLAHGLASVRRFLQARERREGAQPVWTVLLTDGRGNVSLGGADPWEDVLSQATALAACRAGFLVVDTETGWPRLGKAAELAGVLGAPCRALEEVLGRPLADPRRRAV